MSHSELAIAGFYDHEEQTDRRAPDWGGDDLFTSAVPRRGRFTPSSASRATSTGARPAHPARLRETAEHHLPARAAEPVPEPVSEDRYLEPVPEGRRTVTITGRPDSYAVTRRPARSIDERIAHRPERIASWTCAMGFLLILLAILTSH